MRFAWDSAKNDDNIGKHGIDFADVQSVFSKPMLVALDTRFDYGEDRWIGLGILRDNVVVVVFVEKQHDTIRIISARKANSYESRRYFEFLADGLA